MPQGSGSWPTPHERRPRHGDAPLPWGKRNGVSAEGVCPVHAAPGKASQSRHTPSLLFLVLQTSPERRASSIGLCPGTKSVCCGGRSSGRTHPATPLGTHKTALTHTHGLPPSRPNTDYGPPPGGGVDLPARHKENPRQDVQNRALDLFLVADPLGVWKETIAYFL